MMRGPDPDDAAFATGLADAVEAGAVRGVVAGPGHLRLLGRGESYAAWLLTRARPVSDSNVDGGRPAESGVTLDPDHADVSGSGEAAGTVLIRVAVRPPEDLPRPIAAEFTALQQVPAGIGTRGIAYDDTQDNPLGHAYVVTTYLPGTVRPAGEWTADDTVAHLRRLARFHHEVGPTTDPAPPALAEAESGLRWWTEARPDIVADPRVQALLEPWLAYLRDRRDAWTGASAHRLIHSDLVVTNIVVSPDGVPGYIDWEWAGPGDVAKDLALFGGTVHGGPWYVPLTDAEVATLVDTYVTARADLGDHLDRTVITVQRDAWEVAERLLGCLHFLTRAEADPAYRAATDDILGRLARRLGV